MTSDAVKKFAAQSEDRALAVSVVIVSFNTRDVLRQCLRALEAEGSDLVSEVFVVDNGSSDGSPEMVAQEFPLVRLVDPHQNLGFAAANNLAFSAITGKYIVLLNSDAYLSSGDIRNAVEHMENEPRAGLGGARLIGVNGEWQPSARQFPSLLNDFLSLSGLAHRFRGSRFWGRADRTWADPLQAAIVDWVPGAFSILRTSVLEKAGRFDESFFLYYEEVDLCRRIKAAGFEVRYWPDIVVTHLGGESSKSMHHAVRSKSGAQLTLWRLRSGLLYYRKHHGNAAWRVSAMEAGWHWFRYMRNRLSGNQERRAKAEESRSMIALVKQAWKETQGGRYCPPRPW